VASAAVNFTGGTYTAGTGTFTFNGAIVQNLTSAGNTIGTIAVSGTGSNLTVADTARFVGVTIGTGATLTAGSQTINVTGNWVNSGTFSSGSGTVIFDSATTQGLTSGGSSFYNLTVSGGTTLTANDAFTVTGTTGLTIGSATDSLNLQGYNFSISKLSFNGRQRNLHADWHPGDSDHYDLRHHERDCRIHRRDEREHLPLDRTGEHLL